MSIKINISEESKKQVQEMTAFLTEMKKTISDISSQKVDFKTFKEAEKGAKETKKSLTDLEKAQEKLTLAQSKGGKEIIKVRTETSLLNSETRKNVREAEKAKTAYGRLEIEYKKGQEALKNIGAQYGLNSKQFQKAQKDFKNTETRFRQLNMAVKDGRPFVGQYSTAFRKLTMSVKSLMSAFGVIAGLQAFVSLIRNATSIIKDFDQAQANLASILGKTKAEISDLSQSFKDLGSTTAFSATEATKAGIELAKLGFPTAEIQALTPEVLKTATALGVDLASASELVGSQLRAFQLDAEEAGRVSSVLGVSTTKTSLDFSRLQTALGNAGASANAYFKAIGDGENTLEKTVALLGMATDSGIDASTAGTSLRNIFMTLSDSGMSLNDALTQIRDSQNSLSTATELFDKRTATTAIALANNIDRYDELTASITNQDEALEALVNERLNTIDGALQLAQSAWEGFILSIEDGNGVFAQLSILLINLFTKVLQRATSWITDVSNAFSRLTAGLGVVRKSLQPLIDLFSKLGDRIKQTTLFQKLFSGESNNLLKVLKIINTPLLGIVTLFRNLAGVINGSINVISSFKDEITNAFLPLVEFVRDFDLSRPFESIKRLDIGAIKNSFSTAGKNLGSAFSQGFKDVVDVEVPESTQNIADEVIPTTAETPTGGSTTEKTAEETKTLLEKVDALLKEKKAYEDNIATIEQYQATASPEYQEEYNKELENYQEKLKEVNDELLKAGTQLPEYANAQELINEAVNELSDNFRDKIQKIDDEWGDKEKGIEYYNKIRKEQEKFASETLDKTQAFLQKILDEENLSAKDRIKVEEDLQKAKDAIRERELQKIKEQHDKDFELAKENEKRKQEIKKEFTQLGFDIAQEIGNEFFGRAQERRELEFAQFEEDNALRLEEEIRLANEQGATQEELDALRARSEAKLAKEKNKIRQQEAVAQKKQAMFDIAINTAIAFTAGMAKPAVPPFPSAIAAGALGAVQLALVASRPVPKFKHGTKNFKGGLAEFGEAGAEKVTLPTGESFLQMNRTIDFLPKGTRIDPNYSKETQQALGENNGQHFKRLGKTISKNRPIINVTVQSSDYANYILKD